MRVRRSSQILLLGSALLAVPITITWPPRVDGLAHANPVSTSYMQHRGSGAPSVPPGRIERWVELDSISPLLVCAVVKAEDRLFFRHNGFDWTQLRKAAWRSLRGGSSLGASTITQQTARNLYLGPERTVRRKAREAIIAHRLDRRLTKERILEIYLNTIEWGDGIWGVDAASRGHLDVPPSNLDAFESSFLASLIASPRRRLHGEYRRRAERVQQRVLEQMYQGGLINVAEWRIAQAQTDRLHGALSQGTPVTAALAAARASKHEWAQQGGEADGGTLVTSRAVSGGCGLAREAGG